MRWYKILARILLIHSVIDFALAAPVVVQEHEVRVSVVEAAKDRKATSPLRRDPSDKWLESAADQTNVPPTPRSLDPRREHKPRQYTPWLTDSDDPSIDDNHPVPPRPPSPITGSPAWGSPGSLHVHVHSPPNLGDDLADDLPGNPGNPSGDLLSPLPIDSGLPGSSGSYLPSLDDQTDKSYSPPQEPIDNHPVPTPPSDPGPSTGPNPSPSAKRPHPEEQRIDLERYFKELEKIFNGKFKRRFSGSGALNAAHL